MKTNSFRIRVTLESGTDGEAYELRQAVIGATDEQDAKAKARELVCEKLGNAAVDRIIRIDVTAAGSVTLTENPAGWKNL